MPFVNSHMPRRAPAMLLLRRVLRGSPRGSLKYPNCYSNSSTDHLFCSVLLPLFTVVGMDHYEDWYASDNNLRGTPRGSQKYPNCYSNSSTDQLFCSVLLPLFTVVGMDHYEDWYASDNNLRGTQRGSRKEPNAGRCPTCHLFTAVL
jgi:hypothetical protein